VAKSKIGRNRTRLWGGACAVVAALCVLAPASSSAELPLPTTWYPYYEIPEVSVEINGLYSERYTDPEGNVEDVKFSFTTKRSFEATWSANESPPKRSSSFDATAPGGPAKLNASGTHEIEFVDFPGEPDLCEYSPLSAEPASEQADGLIELKPSQFEPGHMTVRANYPLNGAFIKATPTAPEFECSSAVATSGDPSADPRFLEAISPLVEAAVNFESGQAEQTVSVPHSYSGDVGGDQFDLSDLVTVKIDRLPLLPPPLGTEGPPEMRGPTTPITPPTTPPKPPVIQEPEVEANPPVITGGEGAPPKLRTGITAKCPPAGKPCAVTGIVEAELPAPRPARKADASRKAMARRVVLGRVSFPLAAGASKKVAITLSKAGVAFLRSHPGVRAKIAVTVTAPGTATASRTRIAKLRLPASHGRH
jgi:hypothetical protein